MLRVKNLVKSVALFSVVFGAGATVATVALSYLPMVNASSTKVAQGLKQSKAEETDEEYGFKFRLQNCNRSGKTVVCNVLGTNLKSENQEIWISWSTSVRSRVVDSSGNQYVAKQAQIGQSIAKDGEILSANLITGIPTKLIYSFDIPPEVTNLAVIEVNYRMSGKSSEDRKVAIRDITIGGSQASNPSPTNAGTKCTCPPATNPKKPRPR